MLKQWGPKQEGKTKMFMGSHNVKWGFTESSEETTLRVRADLSAERRQDHGVRVLFSAPL